MIIMMDGTGLPRGSQIFSALFGYLMGLQCGVASFLFGRHVGVYLNRWRNPHLLPDGDDAQSAATRVRSRSRRRSTNNRLLRQRRQRRTRRASSVITERHTNMNDPDRANDYSERGEGGSGRGGLLGGVLKNVMEQLRHERARRRRGQRMRREAAKLSVTTTPSKSPGSSVSCGGSGSGSRRPRSKSVERSKVSGSAGHSGRSSKSTTPRNNRHSNGRKEQHRASSTRRHQAQRSPSGREEHRHRHQRNQQQQQRHPPNIIVMPSPTEVLSATDSLRRLPSRLCTHRTAPFVLLLSVSILYVYGDIVANIPFYRTMWLSLLFTPPGAILRWKLSRYNGKLPWWCGIRERRWIPVGTLSANILGSLVSVACAAAVVRLSSRDNADEWEWAVHCLNAVKVGFAGSLSTVSTYVKEVVDITERYGGRNARGYKYAFGTMVICCLLGLLVYSPVARM